MAFKIHIDSPDKYSFSDTLNVRGWLASHEPIEYVCAERQSLLFEERPDVKMVYADFPYVIGFTGSISTRDIDDSIMFSFSTGGEKTYEHFLPGNNESEKRIYLLESENEKLKQRNSELESILGELQPLPIPDKDLRFRIGKHEDLDHFWGVGRKLYWDLKQQLKIVDKTIDEFQNILDFGCGCGRVIRYFAHKKMQKIFGIDIDKEAIEWCQDNLFEIANFSHIGANTNTQFKNDTFDFIYGISVFTHLPEDIQYFWLEELSRITKPGGYVVLSINDSELLSKEDLIGKKTLSEKGFYYSINRHGTAGLPDFYQTAFHTDEYIQKHWSKSFEIIKITWRGFNFHQKAVLLQR